MFSILRAAEPGFPLLMRRFRWRTLSLTQGAASIPGRQGLSSYVTFARFALVHMPERVSTG